MCKAPLIIAFLLTLSLGYLVGRLTTVRLSIPDRPIAIRADERASVPTVRIDAMRNGNVEGALVGDVRFFIGDRQIMPNAAGAFSAEAGVLRTDVVTIDIPEGALFVASARGTKYYPVDSAGGSNIVPENRIYFDSNEAAEAKGYVR